MGQLNNTNAVVDTQARVIEVQGLRVVNAAAFPLVPSGHSMVTVCESFLPMRISLNTITNIMIKCLCREDCM